jgi:hypothetical protein
MLFSYTILGWKMHIVYTMIKEHPAYLLAAYALFLAVNLYRETKGLPRESFPLVDTVVRPPPPAILQALPAPSPATNDGTWENQARPQQRYLEAGGTRRRW